MGDSELEIPYTLLLFTNALPQGLLSEAIRNTFSSCFNPLSLIQESHQGDR